MEAHDVGILLILLVPRLVKPHPDSKYIERNFVQKLQEICQEHNGQNAPVNPAHKRSFIWDFFANDIANRGFVWHLFVRCIEYVW